MTKIRVNDDKELVAEIKAILKTNGGYCPCALIQDKDSKCMCKIFREMTEGECPCGLYIKEKKENNN